MKVNGGITPCDSSDLIGKNWQKGIQNMVSEVSTDVTNTKTCRD